MSIHMIESWTLGAGKVPRGPFNRSSQTTDEDPEVREEAWLSQVPRDMKQKKLLQNPGLANEGNPMDRTGVI